MIASGIWLKKGFTLIELIITIVILGFTLNLLVPFFQAIEYSSHPVVRERTVALGQALVDEVLSKRWDENTPVGGGPICSSEGGTGRGITTYGSPLNCATEVILIATPVPGKEGGEVRTTYNDVDDYASMAPEIDNFTDQAGVAFSYKGYSRSVAVDYVASNLAVVDKTTATAGGTTDTKRVRVTITNPLGEQFVFVALVCNF